jgi:Tol biopolymer transport system component
MKKLAVIGIVMVLLGLVSGGVVFAQLGRSPRLSVNTPEIAKASPSPEGKIAFSSMLDGDREIYVMDPDGSNLVKLTDNSACDVYPNWSPDGTKIAFASDRDGNFEIYVMNADGSNQTRLTYNQAEDTTPVWSPDGSKIAFLSNRDGNYEIYVMNADGSEQINLTNLTFRHEFGRSPGRFV